MMDSIIGSASRELIVKKFIRGKGIEIGALHCPTTVPDGVKVTYVDRATIGILKRDHADVDIKITDYVISDAEYLEEFNKDTQDFVIANHVLEHLENPLKSLESMYRVLKQNGIAMISLPDKNQCFDRKRNVTPMYHLLLDYIEGPEQSKREHYFDWYQNSELEGLSGEILEKTVDLAYKNNQNIHFHVFDYKAMLDMFTWTQDKNWFSILNHGYGINNGGEIIWILQKI